MAVSFAPTTVTVESGQRAGAVLRGAYLVQNGTDPETGEPILTLDDAGPATFAFLVSGGALHLDDDEAAVGALRMVLGGGGQLILYE